MQANRRRGAVDWTAAPDDTESEAGSAAIEAWLGRRPASGADEWAALLDRMRRELGRLVSHPLVRHDPVCQAILGGLAAPSSLAEIDAAMGALGQRVAVLLADGAAAKATAPPQPAAHAPAASRLQALRGFLRL